MAQHSNEHLTIADLSAYLDEEMAPEELALCRVHIQSCQPCQAALADLRLTSALLSSMPQVAVPRSFALPTNIVVLPETPAIGENTSRLSSRTTSRVWQRSLRIVSTLAAVLGLFLFLSGALSTLSHSGTITSSNGTTSAPVYSSAQNVRTPVQASASASSTPPYVSPTSKSTRSATELTTPVPFSTPTTSTNMGGSGQNQGQPSAPQSGFSSILDLTQPAGRLAIGAALFLLGILGAVTARLYKR